MDGTVVELGGAHLDAPGLDLLGVVCGSEGQLGVVTEATLRILRKPEGARPVLDGLLLQRGRRRLRLRHHPRRRPARRHRVHGPPVHPRLRGLRPRRLPRRRGAADHRGRGRRGRDRRAARQDHRHRRAPRPRGDPPEPLRRGSGADLEGPQGRLRRHGPDRRLHLPRRHHPGLRAPLRPPPHRRAHRRATASASPTSSTPATATCTRCILYDASKPGRARQGRGARRRHPRASASRSAAA